MRARRWSAVALLCTAVLATAGWLATHDRGTTLIVAAQHPAADDANRGTADEPFRTITAAVAAAEVLTAGGERTTVRVLPGVYRESVDIGGAEGAAPLTIAGAGPQDVVVTGADVLRDWQEVDRGVFAHDWNKSWGLADLPTEAWEEFFAESGTSDLARRQEGVWVDEVLLRQVLTADELGAQAGTFFVDDHTAELLVHLPPGRTADDAAIEVAVRESVLTVTGRGNVTVRGMTFQRAAAPLQTGGVRFVDTHDVVVEDARMVENNWAGLAVQRSSDIIVRRVAANNNGVMGVSLFEVANVKLIDVENSANNTWRGEWAGYDGWETGAKIYAARGVDIKRWRAEGNNANGLWLDTDVTDVTIEGAVLAGNRRRGLFLEAVQGPIVLRDSVICGNEEAGIVDGKSDGVTVADNRVFGNGEAQLLISGEPGGRSFTAYDTDEEITVRSVDWTVRNNQFAAESDQLLVASHLDEEEFAAFTATLTADGNRWSAPTPEAFGTPAGVLSFDGWRELTGQDSQSRFEDSEPGQSCP